jgi:hypothetical protein
MNQLGFDDIWSINFDVLQLSNNKEHSNTNHRIQYIQYIVTISFQSDKAMYIDLISDNEISSSFRMNL